MPRRLARFLFLSRAMPFSGTLAADAVAALRARYLLSEPPSRFASCAAARPEEIITRCFYLAFREDRNKPRNSTWGSLVAQEKLSRRSKANVRFELQQRNIRSIAQMSMLQGANVTCRVAFRVFF